MQKVAVVLGEKKVGLSNLKWNVLHYRAKYGKEKCGRMVHIDYTTWVLSFMELLYWEKQLNCEQNETVQL